MTIQNDTPKNYFFMRKKMFRIIRNQPVTNETVINDWKKSIFCDDFPKEKLKEVVRYANPKELPEELVFPYISFLERKCYKGKDFAFVKDA